MFLHYATDIYIRQLELVPGDDFRVIQSYTSWRSECIYQRPHWLIDVLTWSDQRIWREPSRWLETTECRGFISCVYPGALVGIYYCLSWPLTAL